MAIPAVANPLTARMHKGVNTTLDEGQTALPVAFAQNQRDEVRTMDVAGALAAEPGMKQQTYIAFHNRQDPDISGDVTHPLGSRDNGMAVAFQGCMTPELPQRVRVHGVGGSCPTLASEEGRGHGVPTILAPRLSVRRLLPEECEALQGFPKNFTRIPWRNKTPENCPDGNRYKCLGNSMAVNCMEWIGRQIAKYN